MRKLRIIAPLFTSLLIGFTFNAFAASSVEARKLASATKTITVAKAINERVTVKENQLVVDGEKQPQLFGAEVQYFRMRGGYGPNVPRERVIELWTRALDHFQAAKMNMISFYIPWDFHEYKEGHFDFTGTADEDGDGRADYPSRDLVTFFKMIEERGIKRIMVRPGPYINAEWGFLGFGAIPEWFHHKYMHSHMQTHWGWRTGLYDYHSPDLLRHTHIWFETLYNNVLKSYMGPGRPIQFVQLDNETNFQWSSIFNHDYGPLARERYQKFLLEHYGSIANINSSHGRYWRSAADIRPPIRIGENLKEDQDWYRFADYSIFSFLVKVRRIWEEIGVREPDVIFTLAESYNVLSDGILPNYKYRNAPNQTGLMTVNLYPKTYDTPDRVLMNLPFKADHDVVAADEANDKYFGSKQEWVLGPEIQGGWWRTTDVSRESRRQTYLTVIGRGMKAMLVYYFNEGHNWNAEWGYKQTKMRFDQLRDEWKLTHVPMSDLSNEFWGELQARLDREQVMNFNARRLMNLPANDNEELFFDAPLGLNAEPRDHYFELKELAEKVITPNENFLARATSVQDDVAIVKDDSGHVTSPYTNINSPRAASHLAGGLLGYLQNADITPRILHGELSVAENFQNLKALFYIDTGLYSDRTLELVDRALNSKTMLVNTLANDLTRRMGFSVLQYQVLQPSPEPLVYFLGANGQFRLGHEPDAVRYEVLGVQPLFTYDLTGHENCSPIMYWKNQVVAYQCSSGDRQIAQIGAPIFEAYNTDNYSNLSDTYERKVFIRAILAPTNFKSKMEFSNNASRIVAFGRQDPLKELLWITVKTGLREPQSVKLKLDASLLKGALNVSANNKLLVRDLLGGREQTLSVDQIVREGFQVELGPDGSTVYTITK